MYISMFVSNTAEVIQIHWYKRNSWYSPGVVVVIPLKSEVWHIKFWTIPLFLNIMDIWHDTSLAFYCVICVGMDIIILTQVPDDLL